MEELKKKVIIGSVLFWLVVMVISWLFFPAAFALVVILPGGTGLVFLFWFIFQKPEEEKRPWAGLGLGLTLTIGMLIIWGLWEGIDATYRPPVVLSGDDCVVYSNAITELQTGVRIGDKIFSLIDGGVNPNCKDPMKDLKLIVGEQVHGGITLDMLEEALQADMNDGVENGLPTFTNQFYAWAVAKAESQSGKFEVSDREMMVDMGIPAAILILAVILLLLPFVRWEIEIVMGVIAALVGAFVYFFPNYSPLDYPGFDLANQAFNIGWGYVIAFVLFQAGISAFTGFAMGMLSELRSIKVKIPSGVYIFIGIIGEIAQLVMTYQIIFSTPWMTARLSNLVSHNEIEMASAIALATMGQICAFATVTALSAVTSAVARRITRLFV